MKDHSIYCSLFNANKMQFPWRETLDNWTRFLNGEGQISIAINTSEDDTFESVTEFVRELSARPGNQVEYTVFKTEIPYTDPEFDGKIKDEALKKCNREFATLLDIDEILPLSRRNAWEQAKDVLRNPAVRHDGLILPSLDLFYDEHHVKSVGQKFYLHRNKPRIGRGVVNFARRPDGSIDHKKSDTTEPIYRDTGDLIKCGPLFYPYPSIEQNLEFIALSNIPYVWHTGYLNREQRLRQSAFWAPHWNNRAKAEVEKPITNEELDKIPYYPHNLPHWNQE